MASERHISGNMSHEGESRLRSVHTSLLGGRPGQKNQARSRLVIADAAYITISLWRIADQCELGRFAGRVRAVMRIAFGSRS
jgi:hypothetical protein